MLVSEVGDKHFQTANGDGRILFYQDTIGLALLLVCADTSADGRKVAAFGNCGVSAAYIALAERPYKLGDVVLDRTAAAAKGL